MSHEDFIRKLINSIDTTLTAQCGKDVHKHGQRSAMKMLRLPQNDSERKPS